MNRVIIESPFAGDVERNIKYARECVLDSLLRGEAPIASHLLYTQEGILNDEIFEQRKLGINAGLAWKEVADKHVFYIDYGYSPGMLYAKEYATSNQIKTEERVIKKKTKIMMVNSKMDELKCEIDNIQSLVSDIQISIENEEDTSELLNKLKEQSTSFAAKTLMLGKADEIKIGVGDDEKLFSLISECSKIPARELIELRQKRIREHVLARQVHMVMIHVVYKKSLVFAGKIFYNKDHATVLHALKTVNALLETDKMFRSTFAPVFLFGLEVNKKEMMKKLELDKFIKEQENTSKDENNNNAVLDAYCQLDMLSTKEAV